MAESWIKVHTDILHDPKILRLHPIGRYAWIGLLLLCRSGRPPGTWKAGSRESMADDLACALSLHDPMENEDRVSRVADSLDSWERSRMVSITADQVSREVTIEVLHWRQRQGDLHPSSSPEQTRQRQRLRRDRELLSRPVTTCHDRGEERRVEEKREKRSEEKGSSEVVDLGSSSEPPGDPHVSAPETGAARAGRARRATIAKQPSRESRATKARSATMTKHSPAEFEQFWSLYPKSSRSGKQEAAQAWDRLQPSVETVTQIMRSLAAWELSKQWRKDNGEFIPWPQKFLRKGRWQEIPEPATMAADSWEPPEVRAARGDTSGLATLFRKTDPEVSG